GRKKLEEDVAKKLPAPEKIERIPQTIDLALFREKLAKTPRDAHLPLRNLSMLHLLSDTGCSVSELSTLRWSMLSLDGGESKIAFLGKGERELRLQPETAELLLALRSRCEED